MLKALLISLSILAATPVNPAIPQEAPQAQVCHTPDEFIKLFAGDQFKATAVSELGLSDLLNQMERIGFPAAPDTAFAAVVVYVQNRDRGVVALFDKNACFIVQAQIPGSEVLQVLRNIGKPVQGDTTPGASI